ncbi:hypothetical protein NXC12_PD00141 (plasmid) [Rhizobium etli]|uniref:DUF982 domain-containing protein n=1 Tax=Rhizobium etli TaxID=29449 RepID=A0AAN1BMK5_RHIET|nr:MULTISPECIES: DUF982 domain-containing protein [Rhizobium]ARO32416.1 hypothetical protein NXC14_PA00127 [Rhizobium sp. NXC14]ARQ13246.1 hypothetical protein NXC12_PD00141 [Rhizobium etli]
MNWNALSTFTPVGLTLSGRPVRKVVRTLGDAAHILIKYWPSDDGEEYVSAVKACVDAISGRIAPEQFREAFLRAADEAGITTLTVVRRQRTEERGQSRQRG